MKVKASKRAKKRYIAFEASLGCDGRLSIKRSLSALSGFQYKQAGIRFLKDKYNPTNRRGIFRVNNKHAKEVIGMLNKSREIRTLGMSGTLKRAEEKYLGR